MKITPEQQYKDDTSRMLGDNITYIQIMSGEMKRVVLSGTGPESRKIEQEYAEKDKS